MGALAGVAIAFGLARLRLRWRIPAVALLVVLAIGICEYGKADFEQKDDPRIVADELLTFPVATVALPVARQPGLMAATFLISQGLDGLKPPPASGIESWPGGLGIALDDTVTNLYTLGIMAAVQAGRRRWLNRQRPS